MIWFIIFGVLVFISAFYFIFAKIAENRYYHWCHISGEIAKKKRDTWNKLSNIFTLDFDYFRNLVLLVVLVLGVLGLIVFGAATIVEYSDLNYERTVSSYKIEKDAIEAELRDSIDSAITIDGAYTKVSEYNKNVMWYKTGASSIWVNFNYSKRIADELEYIDLEKIGVEE